VNETLSVILEVLGGAFQVVAGVAALLMVYAARKGPDRNDEHK